MSEYHVAVIGKGGKPARTVNTLDVRDEETAREWTAWFLASSPPRRSCGRTTPSFPCGTPGPAAGTSSPRSRRTVRHE